jgi:putative membrane protein
MRADDRGLRILLSALLAALLVGLLLSGSLMGPGMMGRGMMWGSGPWASNPTVGGWTWGLSMALVMLVRLAFWGALLVGIVLLGRWLISRPTAPARATPGEEPLAILKRRYAAGEIDQPTYERMKQELGS